MRSVHLFALAAVLACASSKNQRASGPPSSDRNVITEEEIRSIPASNLYELVQKLRPNMLRARGQSSLGGSTVGDYPVVFVDGRSYGDIGSLRSLIPSQVSLVRYYEATDAAGKFGMINGSGVIDVTTRQ
ncbi:MAG TPA: hypothetical protein VJ852_04230 [Gemmatimonadaceae bacterium]|nr:hypothetical protein [Gemmatimonadaceae bacterium]